MLQFLMKRKTNSAPVKRKTRGLKDIMEFNLLYGNKVLAVEAFSHTREYLWPDTLEYANATYKFYEPTLSHSGLTALYTLESQEYPTWGVRMSSEFEQALKEQHVPLRVIHALRLAMLNVVVGVSELGSVYAGSFNLTFNRYGIAGLKEELLEFVYIIPEWDTDQANQCKEILLEWANA